MGRIEIILLLLLCSIVNIPTNIYGQSTLQKFKHLTRDNGLSSNRVNYIMEDSQGFVWFGTEDGLNKFDGYSFEVYRDLQGQLGSIPDNSIDYILEDNNCNLWLATRKGLVYFDRMNQKFDVVLNQELKDSSIGNINITSLCFDKQSNLWIGTYKGLFIYDIKNERLDFISYLPDNKTINSKSHRVYCLYKDDKSDMWIGYEDGLLKFNYQDSSFTSYFTELNLQSVQVIKQDSKLDYWIGSDKMGLYYIKGHPDKGVTRIFNKNNGDFISNRIHGLIEDEIDKFYILVRDGGLYYYNMETDGMRFIEHDIYNLNTINSTALISGFKSSNGIVWLGTYNSGVNYIDKAAKKFLHYKVNFKKNSLFNNNIRALLEDSDSNIWIGTKEGGGLSRFNTKTEEFKNYKKTSRYGGLKDDYIFSICELNKSQLLIGTFRNGIALFDKNTEYFTYFTHNSKINRSISDNRVYSIYKDLQGIIWVGNYNDLQQFDIKKRKFTTILDIKRPRCFCDEDEDRLWIGSKDHGLYIFNKISGKYINYLHNSNDPKSISSNDIYALQKDNKGNLWIGTKHGINKFDFNKSEFVRYTEDDGLSANWICGLLLDDEDNVWVSSTNGISKLDRDNNEFHNYDIKDGLQGNEFEGYVALKTKDGHMLFGGRNGFNKFLPKEIIDNKKAPEIVLTGLKLFNREVVVGDSDSPLKKPISFTDEIVLKHNQSAITIEYVALNFTSPEKNNYAYKLQGFDTDWINAGTNRSAVYTNIPPGEYTFFVKGSNNDNYWNDKGVKLKITILKPMWRTIWAYIIYVLVLAVLFYFIRRILVFRIKQNNLLKLERLDKKRIQELNNLKLRFFTNISHEFRTPLTLISGPLGKLMSYKNDNDEQKYLYHIMHNNVQRLLILVNELMDFRKAEQGKLKLNVEQSDFVVFIQQIVDCFEDTALENRINFSFDYDLSDFSKLWFDKSVIDKVILNLLSNAFKYTPINGQIKIGIFINGGNVIVKVIDSGRGIPEEKFDNIFERFYQVDDKNITNIQGTGIGLSFSKRLIELHHGTITVESEFGKGSTFMINFPINKSSYNNSEIARNKSSNLLHENLGLNKLANEDNDFDSNDKVNRPEKVLIVEDNKELRKFIAKSLSYFEILTANNGKEGYKIANTKIPDIIISDIMMPEMNGLELCKKLKTQFATSHVPIILLTAKTEMSQKIEGIETGADAYIEKPFDINYLEARVNSLLMQRSVLRKRYSNESDIDAEELVQNIHEKKFIDKTKCIIEKNISNSDFSVETFGFELGLSRSQLFRKFKSIYGLKPSEFIRNERLKQSKKLLLEGEHNVNEIADLVGFKSSSYFITSFKKYYKKTPIGFISKE